MTRPLGRTRLGQAGPNAGAEVPSACAEVLAGPGQHDDGSVTLAGKCLESFRLCRNNLRGPRRGRLLPWLAR